VAIYQQKKNISPHKIALPFIDCFSQLALLFRLDDDAKIIFSSLSFYDGALI
jgi:hypothetical protein